MRLILAEAAGEVAERNVWELAAHPGEPRADADRIARTPDGFEIRRRVDVERSGLHHRDSVIAHERTERFYLFCIVGDAGVRQEVEGKRDAAGAREFDAARDILKTVAARAIVSRVALQPGRVKAHAHRIQSRV